MRGELPGRTMDFDVSINIEQVTSLYALDNDVFAPKRSDSLRRSAWQSQVRVEFEGRGGQKCFFF